MSTIARICLVVLIAVAIAGWLRPTPARPGLEIQYAHFEGRIALDGGGATAVLLDTPHGEVTLLPNRFEGVVGWLAGRRVEMEGLLLTIARRPLLWIEGVRVVEESGERRAVHPDRHREVAI